MNVGLRRFELFYAGCGDLEPNSAVCDFDLGQRRTRQCFDGAFPAGMTGACLSLPWTGSTECKANRFWSFASTKNFNIRSPSRPSRISISITNEPVTTSAELFPQERQSSCRLKRKHVRPVLTTHCRQQRKEAKCFRVRKLGAPINGLLLQPRP
jgi:hypothetical protein